MRFHRRSVLILSLILMFCLGLFGCGDRLPEAVSQPDSSQATESETEVLAKPFVLPYTANDTLNPYSAQTKNNQELTTLLYDSLIRLDSQMQVEYWLAESIELNGTSCIIDLRNATFSDGSEVTAEDVTFSIKTAREETTGRYADRLKNIASQSAASSTRVSITLSNADPYFIHLLDFPIFKRGTETNTNEDNKALPPVGSGRYTYHAEGQICWLEANPLWQGGSVGIGRIELKNLPDEEAVQYSLQTDGISAYYTNLSDNKFPQMSGGNVSVPLFNLVYLGMNTLSGPLKNAELRQILNGAVNRNKICKDVFYGSAQPAEGPIPSCFEQVDGLQTAPIEKNTAQVVAQLNELGYNTRNSEGYFTKEGKHLVLRLVYNAEQPSRGAAAALIVSEFKEIGVEVTPVGLGYTEYLKAVNGGSFDLYLAEMKLPNNLDLGSLVAVDAVAPTGSLCRSAAADYRQGTVSLTVVLSAFNEEMPLIPLCHRTGLLTYTSRLQGSLTPGFSDVYAGLEHCKMS